jgi:branched-chain amino acid transport system substrate-binding protein
MKLSQNTRKSVRRCLTFFLILVSSFATTSPANLAQERPAKDRAIKIGVFLDLSGGTAAFGRSTLQGIRLAVDKINKGGGINGQPIEIISRDDQGLSYQAATVATSLIDEDRVAALIGEVASSFSLAAAPKAQASRVPMISPASTHPVITQGRDYVFRVCFIDPFQGEAMARFARYTLKARKAAILVDAHSDYSKSLTQTFETTFAKVGGRVITKQSYQEGDQDFHAQLFSIRSLRPDVIYVPGYYSSVGLIAKEAQRLRLRQPLLGGDGWDSPLLWTAGGAALNGSYMTNHYVVDDPSEANRQFVIDYRARYSTSPDSLAALGYDAIGVLAAALKRAGTTVGPDLRNAIAQTRNFRGVTGNITIDGNGNAVKPAVIVRLQNGKFAYYGLVQPAKPAMR